MAIGAGMSCVKYLLFSFNLLFAITGLIILIVGIKSEINAHPYVDLTDESFYTSAPVILIIVGLIVFIVAFFGCCGAVKENHCMIVTFSVFLLLIFIAELAVGIAGYVKHKDLETSIGRTLNESLTHYSTDPDIKKNYDIIQTDMHCCGIYGFEDWSHSKQPLPSSCCDTHAAVTDAPPSSPAPPAPPTCTVTSPDLHKDGCLGVILTRLQAIALLLGGVGLGIALVQFSVFLLLIFIAELAVGIAGYVKHKDLETSIGRTLNESLTHYSTDPDIKKNYDIIQTDMHCCGIYGFEDWSHSKQPLPSSCCDTHAAVTDAPPSSPAPPAPPTCTVTSPDLHKDGCLGVILTRLQAIALLLGGVGLGIALVQFSVFLLLIFIAELAVGIAGYVKHKDLETSIGRTLNESLTHYSTDPDIKKNYDIIQTDMHCCGIYGFEDWSHSKQPLPSSCCDTHAAVTDAPPSSPAPPAPPTCTVTSPDLHKDGCLGVILTRLQAIALLLGGVGLGIALVQLLGVIFACCLARSIRSQYETV